MAGVVALRNDEIERLQAIIKKLQRMQFGRRSERLDPDQLALGLEDLDADIGAVEEKIEHTAPVRSLRPHRQSLPDHLPREEVLLDIDDSGCAGCGGALHKIGESQSEMLDWVPATFKVIRITRPKYACRTCGTVTQVAAPERPLQAGWQHQRCWRMCLSPNIAIIFRFTVSRKSLRATVLTLPVRRWLVGLAARAGGSKRCTYGWEWNCSLAATCSLTIRRFRCSIRGAAKPRQADCGSMPAMTDLGRARATGGAVLFAPDRKAERPLAHLRTSKAWCMLTAMPGSSG